MSFYYILLFFACLNVSGYFVVRHFSNKKKESSLFITIAIISCIIWAATIGMSTYIYFVSNDELLVYAWGASMILGFISTISMLIIKLISYYK